MLICQTHKQLAFLVIRKLMYRPYLLICIVLYCRFQEEETKAIFVKYDGHTTNLPDHKTSICYKDIHIYPRHWRPNQTNAAIVPNTMLIEHTVWAIQLSTIYRINIDRIGTTNQSCFCQTLVFVVLFITMTTNPLRTKGQEPLPKNYTRLSQYDLKLNYEICQCSVWTSW
jgi:hypothetical protein